MALLLHAEDFLVDTFHNTSNRPARKSAAWVGDEHLLFHLSINFPDVLYALLRFPQ